MKPKNRYKSYRLKNGEKISLEALTDKEMAVFASMLKSFQANMNCWEFLSKFCFSFYAPLQRMKIPNTHPLYTTFSDMWTRLGVKQKEMAQSKKHAPFRCA